MEIIAYAIPAFVGLILLELVISRLMKRKVYRFADAVSDLNCGVSSQLVGLLLKGLSLGVYLWVYESHRVVDFEASGPQTDIGGVLVPNSWVMWALAFVGFDFLYYWWHRHSHRVNFLWAAHVVHHQSEDYNLAVALRQAWFTGATSFAYYLPLAWLGVHPVAFAISNGVSLLYQFWIHTELIGKFPRPIEWLMNTPAHHRVHQTHLRRRFKAWIKTLHRMWHGGCREETSCFKDTPNRLFIG